MLAVVPYALDFWEYETLATNIVNGYGYVIYRFGHVALAFGDGNLYSFLAATVYSSRATSRWCWPRVQAVIASLAAPVIFAIGARAFALARGRARRRPWPRCTPACWRTP